MRASGRTTRLIDESIQELFTNGGVCIIDHHNTSDANRYTFDKFVHRLISEHGTGFRFDRKKLTVRLPL